MAQVESQAEALGATALTWVLFQGKRKTTEGFRQERCVGHLEPLNPYLPLSRMFYFLCNWYNYFGKQSGII